MIFYITVSHGQIGDGLTFKFIENLLIGFSEYVDQDIEPAAMGHPDDKLVNAQLGPFVDDRINGRDGAFPAFEGESFLSYIFDAEKFFKYLASIEFLQDMLFFLYRKTNFGRAAFYLFLQPLPFFAVGDIHVLEAEVPAINGLQLFKYFAQCASAQPQFAAREKSAIEVGLAEAIVRKVEVGVPVFSLAYRVGVRKEMPFSAVSVNQAENH